MSIELDIPLEKTFVVQEGSFRGRLHSVSKKLKTSKTSDKEIRLVFELSIPSIKNKIPTAGRNFPADLNAGSELREFLEHWLGRTFFEDNAGRRIEMESLIGREADLILTHYHNDGYKNPWVFIENAFPPGSLSLTEAPAGKD